ncbi:endosialidase [Qiania dongpingensis]|uniref:Endosialidase n=1 Tax=Qiania dongpingensis TaxID=2763669 RepID=A0A7G9G2P7_9FIRM|nr:endosialidase [Qiania dongpingensis]QNM05079.1 endosialidase [Qiania dongpingensis]
MPAVKELIRTEQNGTLSFGDYTLGAKSKLQDYEFNGDLYKVKTYCDITKLERNGMFVYESVPGTAVNEFEADDTGVHFIVEGSQDAQITLELEDDTEYDVRIGEEDAGMIKANMSGKLTLSVELSEGESTVVEVKKR